MKLTLLIIFFLVNFFLNITLSVSAKSLDFFSKNKAEDIDTPNPQPLNNKFFKCPDDLDTLTDLMLTDLPNYANRVNQRSRSVAGKINIPNYVIVAGNPDFQPLPFNQLEYQPQLPNTSEQIFFTTLERQYLTQKVVTQQNFHWLLLTQTPDGWRMVMLFSRFGVSQPNQPPSPIQHTSNGIIGQAISLWLRDCRAGTIRN